MVASFLYVQLLQISLFSYFTIIASVILILIINYIHKNKNLPPGPFGLPILGYWPFLRSENCHLQLQQLQKTYGDVFSFNFAGAFYVNLGSVKAVRDFLVSNADCFERLSDFSLIRIVFRDGIAFTNGDHWKTHKKLVLQLFKQQGMATIKNEANDESAYDTVKETVDFLMDQKGKPVDIVQLLTDKCNSILRNTLFGNSGITEQEIADISDLYSYVMLFMDVTNSLLAGNFAKYFIHPYQPGYREALKNYRSLEKILYNVIDRHKLNLDEENPRGFIDGYLVERKERQAKGDLSYKYLTDAALVGNLVQFVGDGVLSLAHFLAMFLKHVVDNEIEQEKIYAEILEVVGHDRAPTIEDKNKLVYTNALILEILRTTDFFPMFPSQQCIKEVTIRGYRIPKGTMTLINTWGCHYNPKDYEEPEKFDPARYIPKNGKPKPELPVTFGIGRRNCLAEVFTMNQVFLFLTTLIKTFKLSIAEEPKTSTFDYILSGKMKFVAIPRN